MLKASHTLTSGRSIGPATGGLFLVQDAVDLRVGQAGQRPARRRSRNGELAASAPPWCRGRQRPLPQSLFHKAGDDVLQAHTVKRGPGLRLTEQLIGEIDRGPHVFIFMLLCAAVKPQPRVVSELLGPFSFPARSVDFLARLCSAWDFGLLPDRASRIRPEEKVLGPLESRWRGEVYPEGYFGGQSTKLMSCV